MHLRLPWRVKLGWNCRLSCNRLSRIENWLFLYPFLLPRWLLVKRIPKDKLPGLWKLIGWTIHKSTSSPSSSISSQRDLNKNFTRVSSINKNSEDVKVNDYGCYHQGKDLLQDRPLFSMVPLEVLMSFLPRTINSRFFLFIVSLVGFLALGTPLGMEPMY